MSESLLDPGFLRRLDRLELQSRRVVAGQIKGERRSRRRGFGIDFADFRHYTRGDDPRFIDWNIYGRLDRLFVKLFHEEQDMRCAILLDTSRSMEFGEPDKLAFARRLAAAVAYVGLVRQDRIAISCFAGGPGRSLPPMRGRHNVRRTMEFLAGLKAEGETSIAAACRDFARRPGARGIVVLISDLLDPEGCDGALRHLARDGLDVHVFQTLAPEELEPTLGGHVELVDRETGHTVQMTVNARAREAYMHNVRAYCLGIRDRCAHYGMEYSLVRSDERVEDLAMKRLRESGLLKG